eukprot:5347012-Lingulodinium_polyedra.AAC.1
MTARQAARRCSIRAACRAVITRRRANFNARGLALCPDTLARRALGLSQRGGSKLKLRPRARTPRR